VRSTYRGQVQFRDEQERRTLRIGSTDRPAASAVAAVQQTAPALAGTLDDYRQLRLAPATQQGLDAADLEFTYTSRSTALHVLDRAVVSGGTTQTLWWQTQEADFAESLPVFEQVAATFAPPPAAG
jgi:hypothetical protein